MLTKLLFPTVIVSVLVAAACSGSANNPNERTDHPADTGVASVDAAPAPTSVDASTTLVLPPPLVIPKTALGLACSTNADCASGFCTDGLCCDSACGQTCYACNLPAAPGHCAALTSGVDLNASPACIAPSACVLSAGTTVPSCRLMDGSACQSDGDCISAHCLAYYVDADGDGYGSSEEAHFCEELGTPPPAGYAAYSGDCCDLDSGANPAFNSALFLAMPDACGSYDWNCNGVVAQQKSCPTQVSCGGTCTITIAGFTAQAFTEACN